MVEGLYGTLNCSGLRACFGILSLAAAASIMAAQPAEIEVRRPAVVGMRGEAVYAPRGAVTWRSVSPAGAAAGALTIIPTFDSTITSNPNAAAIESAVNAAIAVYAKIFSDPITVSIYFRYSATLLDGSPATALGNSYTGLYEISYSAYTNALMADSTTLYDALALKHLPAAPPAENARIASALGRALGGNTPGFLDAATARTNTGTFDGIVNLNSGQPFQFSRTGGIRPGSYDAQLVLEHEIDEVLGLRSTLPATMDGRGNTVLEPIDVFRFVRGERVLQTGQLLPYLSIDGGADSVVTFNDAAFNGTASDYGDWQPPPCGVQATIPLVQYALICPGIAADVTPTSPEGIALDVIGYDLRAEGVLLPQKITVTQLPTVEYYGPTPIAVTVTASSGLPVTLTSATSAICTTSGLLVSTVAPGMCSITASQPGNSSFVAATPVSITFQVLKGFQTITFPPLADVSLGAPPISLTPTTSSGLPVTFVPLSGTCDISGATLRVLAVGQCSVRADQPGNSNYQPAQSVTQSFTIYSGPSTAGQATIVSAASYLARVAAESIAAAFGSNLALPPPHPLTPTDNQVVVTDSSGMVRVASLLAVSQQQVNFQIPADTAAGLVKVEIFNANGAKSLGWIQISSVAPGLASADGSGHGLAAAFAIETGPGGGQTATLIFKCGSSAGCQPIPVSAGSPSNPTFLELFGTGIRHVTSIGNVTCTVGGVPATVVYAGAQGSFAGLDQVNVLVPPSLANRRGPLDILLTVEGQPANPVTVEFAVP